MKNRVLGKPKKLTYFALFLLEFFCSHQLQMIIDSRILEINTNPSTKILKMTPNFVIFKKKNEFVCFPPFYDPQNKNWSFLVGFGQNRKFLGNRQTMKKKLQQ